MQTLRAHGLSSSFDAKIQHNQISASDVAVNFTFDTNVVMVNVMVVDNLISCTSVAQSPGQTVGVKSSFATLLNVSDNSINSCSTGIQVASVAGTIVTGNNVKV